MAIFDSLISHHSLCSVDEVSDRSVNQLHHLYELWIRVAAQREVPDVDNSGRLWTENKVKTSSINHH